MTDRHAGYIVVLEKDIREDCAKSTIEAIKHIKGVIDVKPVTRMEPEFAIAHSRIRREMSSKMIEAFEKVLEGEE